MKDQYRAKKITHFSNHRNNPVVSSRKKRKNCCHFHILCL